MRILLTQWAERPENTVRVYFCTESAQILVAETDSTILLG
jgi:hypothetical protein